MSRVAKKPLTLPKGVEYKLDGRTLTVKGPKGSLDLELPEAFSLDDTDQVIRVTGPEEQVALRGTIRALVGNMVTGVSEGFERKLELRGVGYRAQMQGSNLNLSLGFSHPVEFAVPDGVSVETPSQTEVVVKGTDKQKVGQVAAIIRAYRPPEPYKGKGVRYVGEHVIMKEAKKA